MLHHVKLPYSCERKKKKKDIIVIGFCLKHIRWLLLSDEDMHEVLLLLPVVSVHEVGNCINIVTYCVIISVGLLSAGRANLRLSVEMHFKVLLCYDQENILLQTYLYRCDFCFCSFVFHKWRFTVLVIVTDPTCVSVEIFLFVHTLCIQCAFLYGDWIPLRSAQLY